MGNFCAYCGKKLSEGEVCDCRKEENVKRTSDARSTMNGKKYHFYSSQWMCFYLLGYGRISTDIIADEEKLKIDIFPKKKNQQPVIYLEDITSVLLHYKMPFYYLVAVTAFLLAMIANVAYILAAALFIWLGSNWKITIFLRNGNKAEIYSGNKKKADAFVNDLKQATGV